eukprot:7518811-Lingulodinium_polyedra.AAC.1
MGGAKGRPFSPSTCSFATSRAAPVSQIHSSNWPSPGACTADSITGFGSPPSTAPAPTPSASCFFLSAA